MVLTTLTEEEIEKTETALFDLAFDFMMEYGVDISVIVKNEDQFNYWLGALPFYDNVQNEGVVLNGTNKRYKKKSFDWYKKVIESNGEDLE